MPVDYEVVCGLSADSMAQQPLVLTFSRVVQTLRRGESCARVPNTILKIGGHEFGNRLIDSEKKSGT